MLQAGGGKTVDDGAKNKQVHSNLHNLHIQSNEFLEYSHLNTKKEINRNVWKYHSESKLLVTN